MAATVLPRLTAQRAWIAAIALTSLAIASPVARQSEEAALHEDDQCQSGDAGCAVDALQRRGVRSAVDVEELSGSTSSRRRTQNQAKDLTVEQERDLVAQIDVIGKNVTHMEWKLYYFGLDIRSTQDVLLHKENASVGVNGTEVTWTSHEPAWMPTFSLLQSMSASSSPPPQPPSSTRALTEESIDEEFDRPMQASLLQSGRRRRDSLADVPPRTRRTQKYMTTTQHRLDRVWKSLTLVDRRITLLHNYMGSHRRLVRGRAVLTQEAADLETAMDAAGIDGDVLEAGSSHASSVTSSRRRSSDDLEFDEFELEWGSNPEGVLLKQVRSAENQTSSIWEYMGKRGREMEACKRRVRRYEAAADEENPLFDWEDDEKERDIETNGASDTVSETKVNEESLNDSSLDKVGA